jgi:hypothetical protein
MTDGKMERPEIRAYLTQAFRDLRTNLESVRADLLDEENGAPNDGVRECITEMIAVVSGSLLSKVKQDVRFKDTRTCEQCFADFNDSGRHERFCSDTCEEENDTQVGGDDDADLREDDCS